MEHIFLSEEEKQILISTLNGFRRFDKSMKRRLSHIGFTIEKGRKHIKIKYKHSPHIFFTSATGSDHRNGINLAKDIIRKINKNEK